MTRYTFALLLVAFVPVGILAQTPTSCSTSLATPSPSGFVCGLGGHLKSPSPIQTATAPNQVACRDSCLTNQPRCVSFSYGPGNTCITYDQKVNKSQFKRETRSGKVFWNRNCYKKKCGLCDSSSPASTACGALCVNTMEDSSNCGTCRHACQDPLTVCKGGVCSCPTDGEEVCGTACVNKDTDNNNCGDCGKQCPSGSSCSSGSCICANSNAPPCSVDNTCPDLSSNNTHCGVCGTSCTGGQFCSIGTCTCSQSQTYCMDTCVETSSFQTNPESCGGCGTKCGDDETCCSGVCVNTYSNSNNCGSCGNMCGLGQYCEGGCLCSNTGMTPCTGDTCPNISNSTSNCGGCGIQCPDTATCSEGTCICPQNQTRCFGPDRCANLSNDNQNCGRCGNQCTGNEFCTSSSCGCPAPSSVFAQSTGTGVQKTYNLYHQSSGLRRGDPGSPGYYTYYYDFSKKQVCSAVQKCATDVINAGLAAFDLQYFDGRAWFCAGYTSKETREIQEDRAEVTYYYSFLS